MGGGGGGACVCVCMSSYTFFTCTYCQNPTHTTRTHTLTHARTYARTHARTHTHTHTYMRARALTHTPESRTVPCSLKARSSSENSIACFVAGRRDFCLSKCLPASVMTRTFPSPMRGGNNVISEWDFHPWFDEVLFALVYNPSPEL